MIIQIMRMVQVRLQESQPAVLAPDLGPLTLTVMTMALDAFRFPATPTLTPSLVVLGTMTSTAPLLGNAGQDVPDLAKPKGPSFLTLRSCKGPLHLTT